MDIEHLREFAHLAETLNFAATARHFFLSRSVLDAHIASMEQDLQVSLVELRRNHVSLTEAGERFYRGAVAVVEAYDRAATDVAASRSDESLCLRVGYLRGATRPFLPKLVHYMERAHPDVRLDITCMEYGELIRALRAHKVDVILNMDTNSDATDDFDSEYIYTDRLYVVVGKDHKLAELAGGVPAGWLAGTRLALPDAQAYPGLVERYEDLVRNSCDITLAVRYRDIDTLFFHVVQDGCVGLSSGHNFGQFGGQALFLPLASADTTFKVRAFWLRGMDEQLVAVARDAALACAEYMWDWTDGVGASLNLSAPKPAAIRA